MYSSALATRPIRAAQAGELCALSALCLRSKAIWGYDAGFMAACRHELTFQAQALQDSLVVLIDDSAGRAVAVLQISLAGSDLHIDKLFVEPECIGFGLGKRLFVHAVAHGRTLGALRLLVEADPGAAGFYRRMGAEQIGQVVSGSIAGRRLPLFALAL